MSDDIPLQTSLDYVSSRLTNVTVTEDYIQKLCANSQMQSNNTDTLFYKLMILLFAIYPNFSWFSMPNMAKAKSWGASLGYFILMAIIIYLIHQAFQTVPEDCEKNTQLVKNIIFPLTVLIVFSTIAMIYTFSVGGTSGKKFLIAWIFLIIGTIIYLIIKVSDLYADYISFNLKYLPTLFYFIFIGVVLLVQYVSYHKSSTSIWRGEILGYSFPLLMGVTLLSGRLFKLINMIIMTVNNKGSTLETNTDASTSYTTTISTHMTNIIEKLDITGFTAETLYDKLTEYKVVDSTTSYFALLKYLGSGVISLGLYFVTGWLIKKNINDPSLDQQAFPIIGFCNSLFDSNKITSGGSAQIAEGTDNDIIKDIFHNPVTKNIIGTIATKTLLTNYSSTNPTSTFTVSPFITAIKAMLIPYFGGRIHRWYQMINMEKNGLFTGILKLFYAGMDYERVDELIGKNKGNKKLCSDFVYTENAMMKMILYFYFRFRYFHDIWYELFHI